MGNNIKGEGSSTWTLMMEYSTSFNHFNSSLEKKNKEAARCPSYKKHWRYCSCYVVHNRTEKTCTRFDLILI